MTRSSFAPYLFLGLFLFCWISCPKALVDRMRARSVGLVTPFSQGSRGDEWARLKMANQHLTHQLETAYEWLLADRHVAELTLALKEISKGGDQGLLQRRANYLRARLRAEAVSLPGEVIYRDTSSWSSSLWINIGEEDNRNLNAGVIAKNSPVLSEGSLVGVVDYVGKRQSRVRLITDAGLSPAVRAVRGAIQNREMARLLQTLLERLKNRSDLFASQEELGQFLVCLTELHGKLGLGWDDSYLAKGELKGSSAPFWRSKGSLLKGVGFNFDYADEEGKASRSLPILQVGDFLVTSGLDGVFPPGLPVGTVTKVVAPDLGGYAYEIEARPFASHLNDLQTVFVLPPLSAE